MSLPVFKFCILHSYCDQLTLYHYYLIVLCSVAVALVTMQCCCLYLQAVADSIPQLVQGMRSSQSQPEELGAQLALIMASQGFLQV